jgi:formate hydrogenlyase subunit 3/multisubunit Na+/H+ antiporter MnhD subunit
MSGPVLWIVLPLVLGSLTLLILNERNVAITGGLACVVLAGIALILPIDVALRFGPFSFKIASSASFLGRSLVLPSAEAPLLALIFGLSAFWFFGAAAAGTARRLVPVGLTMIALLVGSIAVQPFLYASLLIEMAVLVALPLLAPPGRPLGRGVMRFLIYQTLGMPFILFAGWLLAGVETSPGDLSLTIQSTIMLALGFAFLLAVFPLNDWMPQLMEDSHPYDAGFLLWLLPSIILVFAMGFLDRYAWLRTSPQVISGIRGIGLLMLVSGGLSSALDEHLGRIMAYAAVAETGFLLIALSLTGVNNPDVVFLFLIPRGLGLALWALALSVLKKSGAALNFSAIRGLARVFPWACAALILTSLSTAGFPLLAGFPPRLEVWMGLGQDDRTGAIWFVVGLLALMLCAVRQLAVVVAPADAGSRAAKETLIERAMLGIGILALLVLGLFPQAVSFIVGKLPQMFQHLSR